MLDNDVFALYLRAGSSADVDELAKLACHPDSIIRMRVAENPRAAISTMVMLIGDSDPEVRCAVTENPAVPIFIMDLLAEDENDDVRYWVADNPHTPICVLGKLVLDKNCYVSGRARKWFESTVETFQLVELHTTRSEAEGKLAQAAG
jgi:hypothetical protein